MIASYSITENREAESLKWADKYCAKSITNKFAQKDKTQELKDCVNTIYTELIFKMYKKAKMDPEKEAYTRLQK